MKWLLLILTVTSVQAKDILKVDNLFIESERTFGSNRYLYLPEFSEPKYNLNLGFKISDLSSTVYSFNKISSTVDQTQFRYIALDSELGVNLPINVQLYIRHYSGHTLDFENKWTTKKYPQANVVGLRFNLIGEQ